MGSVSIVLPAYNAMPFLGEALQSVLNQTLQDFEFIIIDDASSDTTASEIARFAEMDSRIVFLANEKRRGVAESLNLGIEAANGTWIARMDADDVAHPRRLERQISYLEANPELILLGTNVGLIDAQGRQLAHRLRMPTSHEDIDALLKLESVQRRRKQLRRDFRWIDFSRRPGAQAGAGNYDQL